MITTLTGHEAIRLACTHADATDEDPPVLVRGESIPLSEALEAVRAGALRPEDVSIEIPGPPPTVTPDGPPPSPLDKYRGPSGPTTVMAGTDAAGGRWERTVTHAYPPNHALHDRIKRKD